jgi:TrmH family RNA methyltransferase
VRLLVIESAHNDRFKAWESATESRGIRKSGQFLLAGRKTVPEALRLHARHFQAILCRDPAEAAALNPPDDMQVVQLTQPLFERLDVSGTRHPLLLGTVPDMPQADLTQPPKGLEVLCALGDPANLGAALRSAAAFGASRVVLLQEAAHPFHPKSLRAAANAPFTLDLQRGSDWNGLASAAGPLVGLDGAGTSLTDYKWPADLRLVLGEEGRGLPADLNLTRLSIPGTGKVESLNATVAVSVAMFAWYAAQT